MGFFTDLKEDLNQAMSELLPDEMQQEQDQEQEDSLTGASEAEEAPGSGEPARQELTNLEEMLQNIDEPRITEDEGMESSDLGILAKEADLSKKNEDLEDGGEAESSRDFMDVAGEAPFGAEKQGPSGEGDLEKELRAAFGVSGNEETMEEYLYKQAMRVGSEVIDKSWVLDLKDMEATDENAVITAGMRVKGDILSNGNLDVTGEVIGNVQVSGKLNVTGRIRGNSKADEIYADSAKITGDLIGDGTVKIGAGSVVIGNIEASSAAIAGAVKGTIDVKGPVVLDATAVVFGNIRAKTMQINNGARIEGMCVLCYAEQSASKFFEAQETM